MFIKNINASIAYSDLCANLGPIHTFNSEEKCVTPENEVNDVHQGSMRCIVILFKYYQSSQGKIGNNLFNKT